MQTCLHAIAQAAQKDKIKRFRSLYSIFNRTVLEEAYHKLNKDAASGVDEVTYEEYGQNLQGNLVNLEERLKQKRYWPQVVKRVEIPKPNGKTRPLGISSLEDKIVQKVAAEILTMLYEPLFLNCSYGYRPNRSAKQAVVALQEEIRGKYAWVVEADIKGFYDHVQWEPLQEMLERRIDDRAFIELIRRMVKSGILRIDGTVENPEVGISQGSIASPVLANVYLHYALDTWFEEQIRPKCGGEAFMLRYADDYIAAFRLHADASLFYRQMENRLREFGLELSKEKTRKIRFTRFKKQESGTFVFLGFEFRWIKTRERGIDTVSMKMHRKKLHRIVKEFSDWCSKHRSKRIAWIMGMVKAKLMGIRNYFGLVGNSDRIQEVYELFRRTLYRWLNRRSERKSYNLKTYTIIWNQFDMPSLRRLIKDGAVQLSFINKLN